MDLSDLKDILRILEEQEITEFLFKRLHIILVDRF